MNTGIHFPSYLAEFFLELDMYQKHILEKIKPYILCSVTFSENRAFYEIMWKNIVEGQATDDNMAHAHCILEK
jgi:hypothetical protein